MSDPASRPESSALGRAIPAPVGAWRVWVLSAGVLLTVLAVFLFPPIPQSQAYHNFADKRTIAGIPNCLNVVSNVLFLIVGVLGILSILGGSRGAQTRASSGANLTADASALGGFGLVDSRERWPYLRFFLGVACTTFGSAYYHFNPNDGTLLCDRIPMAISFTALVAAMVFERTSVKAGVSLLIPLLLFGAGSVVYWDFTQRSGHGDLRPYILAQFCSLLLILLLISLFPSRYTRGSDLIAAFAIYGLAKIFEAADGSIFALGGIASGHTLKHVAAAASPYWRFRMLRLLHAKCSRSLALG